MPFLAKAFALLLLLPAMGSGLKCKRSGGYQGKVRIFAFLSGCPFSFIFVCGEAQTMELSKLLVLGPFQSYFFR